MVGNNLQKFGQNIGAVAWCTMKYWVFHRPRQHSLRPVLTADTDRATCLAVPRMTFSLLMALAQYGKPHATIRFVSLEEDGT